MCGSHNPELGYLGALSAELISRGMNCQIVTTGCFPRLRLEIPWGLCYYADSAFEDHVLAAKSPDGVWRFWWPWIEPIGPITDITGAANNIMRNTTDILAGDGDIEEHEERAHSGKAPQALNSGGGVLRLVQGYRSLILS